jgi:hypothetical protein
MRELSAPSVRPSRLASLAPQDEGGSASTLVLRRPRSEPRRAHPYDILTSGKVSFLIARQVPLSVSASPSHLSPTLRVGERNRRPHTRRPSSSPQSGGDVARRSRDGEGDLLYGPRSSAKDWPPCNRAGKCESGSTHPEVTPKWRTGTALPHPEVRAKRASKDAHVIPSMQRS